MWRAKKERATQNQQALMVASVMDQHQQIAWEMVLFHVTSFVCCYNMLTLDAFTLHLLIEFDPVFGAFNRACARILRWDDLKRHIRILNQWKNSVLASKWAAVMFHLYFGFLLLRFILLKHNACIFFLRNLIMDLT